MNLIYGEVLEAFERDGLRIGKVRVAGAITPAALTLVADAVPGDIVLLCDGVAIGKLQEESSHVSGDPR